MKANKTLKIELPKHSNWAM